MCRVERRRRLLRRFLLTALVACPFATGRPAAADAPPWLDGFAVRYTLWVNDAGEVADGAHRPRTAVARVPTGGWLGPAGADLLLQHADGTIAPVAVLSHQEAGETLVQFALGEGEPVYWLYGRNPGYEPPPAPPLFEEGLTVEFRDWQGDDLSSWAAVVDRLQASDNVQGAGLVTGIRQNTNPFRPDTPRNFAASYRGFLDIREAGVYRFFVNADDAAFLFVDGYLVFSQTGTNVRRTGRMGSVLQERAVNLNFDEPGAYPFELHQVIANNPRADGRCQLIWLPAGEDASWAYVPRSAFAHARNADVIEARWHDGSPAPVFSHGIDDTVTTEGVTLYLARFAAPPAAGGGDRLRWDFGDGVTGAGRAPGHVYFRGGRYRVTLAAGERPPFARDVYVWDPPTPTSPFSLGAAVDTIAALDWSSLPVSHQFMIFNFLVTSNQPDRFALQEALTAHLMETAGADDPSLLIDLALARMEAIAEQGREREAIRLMERLVPDFEALPSQQLRLLLTGAEILWRHARDFSGATGLYRKILEEYDRSDIDYVSAGAEQYGDMLAAAGDLSGAREYYRLAHEMRADLRRSAGLTETVTLGALLRVVEQSLRAGDIRNSRYLLNRIDREFSPEQRVEGLYLFLKAETEKNEGWYEAALRTYERLLALGQWGGYRDRAFLGMADGYHRMNRPDEALEMLDIIAESFPGFYEERELADFRAAVAARAERLTALAAARGEAAGAKPPESGGYFWPPGHDFPAFRSGFAPPAGEGDAPEEAVARWRREAADAARPAPRPGLGFSGRYAGYLDSFSRTADFRWSIPLEHVLPGGAYWVEFWYRTDFGIPLHVGPLRVGLEFGTRERAHLDRTFGDWRKAAFRLTAPESSEATLKMDFENVHGSLLLDDLVVRPISDLEESVLYHFIQSAD